MAPFFIVFEGIDGSGKSTQARLLHEYFVKKNIPVTRLMEPSGGPWGVNIRDILKGKTMPSAEEMNRLFIEDRKDDVARNIIPAMESRVSVIMDRYYYSNAAYQGAMGMPPSVIIHENRSRNFPEPHRVYFIDLPPGSAMKRISIRNDRQESEIFEKQDFLNKVREIYLSFRGDNFIVIDGAGPVEEVFDLIKSDIETLIKGRDFH